VKKTVVDRLAPIGRERESVHAGERRSTADRRGPPVRRRGSAGARARGLAGLTWADWAAFSFSFSLDF
jgi:hypothetical protein